MYLNSLFVIMTDVKLEVFFFVKEQHNTKKLQDYNPIFMFHLPHLFSYELVKVFFYFFIVDFILHKK